MSNVLFQSLTRKFTKSDVFGILCTESEAIALLRKYPKTYQTFQAFEEKYQQELLRFLMGEESLLITYDTFFRQIFDPELHPERLEGFVSAVLGQPIKIVEILPREGKHLSAESSFIIMGIVAQLADGSYFDVEIQKIGYEFPGERTSCYASDLILRQYDRLKKEKGKSFSYRDMKPVHIIVLMENSAGLFKAAAPYYLHKRQISYDSGVSVNELSEIIYISIDTFKHVVQNVTDNPLHAWLTFMSTTNARTILELIGKYPDFLPLYQELAAFRTNPEELMNMFSDALAIMDRNTERYMVEEAQKEVASLKKETESLRKELESKNKEMEASNKELDEARKAIQELQDALNALKGDADNEK